MVASALAWLGLVLPSAWPYILTGLRISLGFSFTAVVAAEMLAASEGIGFLINFKFHILSFIFLSKKAVTTLQGLTCLFATTLRTRPLYSGILHAMIQGGVYRIGFYEIWTFQDGFYPFYPDFPFFQCINSMLSKHKFHQFIVPQAPGPRGSPQEPHGGSGMALLGLPPSLTLAANVECCLSRLLLLHSGHSGLSERLMINSNSWSHFLQMYS